MKASKISIVVFLGLSMIFGCKKDDPEKIGPCGVKDPITELPWLKQRIELFESSLPNNWALAAIGTIVYRKERVFWIYDINSSGGARLFRCDGTSFYLPALSEANEEERQISILIASPKSAMCPYIIWQTPIFKKSVCM